MSVPQNADYEGTPEYPLPKMGWWQFWKRYGRYWRPKDVRLACGKVFTDPERIVWMCVLRNDHSGKCSPTQRAGRLWPPPIGSEGAER